MSLRDQLTAIYQAQGALTPDLVVREAESVKHPLHHRFEWDNAVAGPAYRRVQAADLIRSVKVVYGQREDGADKSVRAFLAVRETDNPTRASYVPAEQALGDDFTQRLLLRECEREVTALQRKYGHLREFAQLLRAAAS